MTLTLKERYNLIDQSKLPESVAKQLQQIKSGTADFDPDLVDIFAANMAEIESIVSQKFPEAIKKGKVVQVKKLVEKKLKPKTAKPKAAKPKAHKKLSVKDIEFIEATLLNDEASSDAELVKYFMSEMKLSELQAKKWVAQRSKYLTAEVGKGRSVSYGIRRDVKGKKGRQVKLEPVKGYKASIIERIGCSEKEAEMIEDSMRNDIFHSTLDWQSKEEFNKGMDEAVSLLVETTKLPIHYLIPPKGKVEKPEKEPEKKEPDEISHCKKVLQDANYKVERSLKEGKRVIKRTKRPDKAIIKEKAGEVVSTIDKDLRVSEDSAKENSKMLDLTDKLRDVLTRILQSIDKIVADGNKPELEEIIKLLEKIAP